MPSSSKINPGDDLLSAQFNALRDDVLDEVSGHPHSGAAGGGVRIHHEATTGLGDDDHPQYPGHAQTETISGAWTFTGTMRVPSGTEFPGAPMDGSIFYRTDEDILYMYDGAAWEVVGGVDPNAIHDNVAGEIILIAEKVAPADADVLVIEDTEAANAKKRVQLSNLPQTDSDAIHDNVAGEIVLIAEKAAPVDADVLIIEDSEAGNAKKRLQMVNLPGGDHPLDPLVAGAVHTGTLKGLHAHADNENKSGECNGVKTVFLTAQEFSQESLHVSLNGQLLTPDDDYTEGAFYDSFAMSVAPIAGDKLMLSYVAEWA